MASLNLDAHKKYIAVKCWSDYSLWIQQNSWFVYVYTQESVLNIIYEEPYFFFPEVHTDTDTDTDTDKHQRLSFSQK